VTVPPAPELLGSLLDERHRIRRGVPILAEVRCPRRHHRLAVIVPTPAGAYALWRAPWVEHTPSGGWETELAADAGPHAVSCTCDRQWWVDLAQLAACRGVVFPNQVRDRQPEGAAAALDDGEPNPFA